jgi:hypothetical protein
MLARSNAVGEEEMFKILDVRGLERSPFNHVTTRKMGSVGS